jgi:hypothetical protein
MRIAWLYVGTAIGFVALADGLAMTLPGPSSGAGGAVLVAAGIAWLWLGLPRVLGPEARIYSTVVACKLGVLLVPLLFLPIRALWSATTPEALTVWFNVAWAVVFALAVAAAAVVPCPTCGSTFHRAGVRTQLTSMTCVHCRAGPFIEAAHEE